MLAVQGLTVQAAWEWVLPWLPRGREDVLPIATVPIKLRSLRSKSRVVALAADGPPRNQCHTQMQGMHMLQTRFNVREYEKRSRYVPVTHSSSAVAGA